MTRLEKKRLFNVRCGAEGNIIYPRIEAKTAEEAIHKSNRHKGQIISQVDSDPIYTASLGVVAGNLYKTDTGNSIFDITIRGTDEEAVDTLKEAIALAIGGKAVDFAQLNCDGHSDGGVALKRFICTWKLSINAM